MTKSRTAPRAGDRFGKLRVLIPLGKKKTPCGDYVAGSATLCICDCGQLAAVTTSRMLYGHKKSCGCGNTNKIKHGLTKTPTHESWKQMRQRCTNPNHHKFHLWGGRGIKVCERWESFENFLADMGRRPPGKTLDRFPDPDGNYEPGNCRWATPKEQRANISPAKKKPAGPHQLTLFAMEE